MLQPVVRRTWAPRGQTPIQRQSQKHDRLSVISAISVSSNRKKFNLYFTIHPDNIRSPEVLRFLEKLLRKTRGKIVIILDGWKVHKAKILRQFFREHRNRIQIEWLPPYSPQLNPVEPVWSHTKYADLANWAPADVVKLRHGVRISLKRTCSKQKLLRAFFKTSGLEI